MKLFFSVIPRLALRLSGSSKMQAMRIASQLYYFALTRKILKIKKDFPLNVSFSQHSITFFLRYVVDIAVLREVFVDNEYDWAPGNDPKVIVDLGAHFGDTALYYHARFPQAKIIAVEPSPENYARLVKHTQNTPSIIAVEAAIGADDGTVELNVGGVHFGHSIFARGESVNKVTVQQLSLPTLFQKHGLNQADLVKFDIEGAEFSMFDGLKPGDFAASYIGEVHLDMGNDLSLVGFKNIFTGFTIKEIELAKNRRYIITANLI